MSDTLNEDYLMWGDIETSGLRFASDRILEIGFKLTTLDLLVVDQVKFVVGASDMQYVRDHSDPFVLSMHKENGLWVDCLAEENYVADVEVMLMDWLSGVEHEFGIKQRTLPLAGSSLALDRNFLEYWTPALHSWFHYRSIDNSTVKELCRRYNKPIYDQLPESETDHRVFTCLDGSIAEFEFYKDNFLMEADD